MLLAFIKQVQSSGKQFPMQQIRNMREGVSLFSRESVHTAGMGCIGSSCDSCHWESCSRTRVMLWRKIRVITAFCIDARHTIHGGCGAHIGEVRETFANETVWRIFNRVQCKTMMIPRHFKAIFFASKIIEAVITGFSRKFATKPSCSGTLCCWVTAVERTQPFLGDTPNQAPNYGHRVHTVWFDLLSKYSKATCHQVCCLIGAVPSLRFVLNETPSWFREKIGKWFFWVKCKFDVSFE